jgi:hypothetical protein
MMVLESWIHREYRRGLSTHPCVESQCDRGDVPFRKSRVQLQKKMFSPRVLSLVTSLEVIMVLNVELQSMNSILT